MSSSVIQKTALAMLTAAALFGAVQVLLFPSSVDAQTAPEAPASAPSTLSATGISQVPGDTAQASGGALMMSIEERSKGTDVQAAVKKVQDRLAKLRSALTAAGVPDSATHVQGFNIGPDYGYPYPVPPIAVDPAAGGGATAPAMPAPSIMPRPPQPSGYMVNAQLMVETTSPEQLATAMRVAIEGGATNVNSFLKGGAGNPTPPAASKLAPAIASATEQAKVMAQASAQAAGLTLGGISSVSVLAPTPSYNGGPGPVPTVTWQVQVRVTYAIK